MRDPIRRTTGAGLPTVTAACRHSPIMIIIRRRGIAASSRLSRSSARCVPAMPSNGCGRLAAGLLASTRNLFPWPAPAGDCPMSPPFV